MRKIILFFMTLFLTFLPASANSISKLLLQLGINKSAISVSIKDVQDGSTVFSLNEKAPMLPASTLKLVTSSAAYDTLGADYKFQTQLYKSTNNDLYLKLGADPFLKSSDLETLMAAAREKNILTPKHIYVDNSIFDNVEWGDGWQWDDDLNPLMPKFSVYNLDGNLLKIEISPGMNNSPASVILKPFYPITLMNLVTTDRTAKNSSVSVERNNSIAPNVINVSGVVSKSVVVQIPVNNTKMYFDLRLDNAVRKEKIDYYNSFDTAVLPKENVYLVSEVTHDISSAMTSVLKSSNNLTAETLFKLAGAKWADSQGSIKNSLNMLDAYLKKININSDDIKVVDGSGVSKNNLMNADFMTDFLVYKSKEDNFEEFKKLLPAPGEGTLRTRMLYFKDNLHAKTGTLSDTSAIAGYIVSRKGKVYAFDIMINDAKTSSADKKNIEEQILRQIYSNY